MKIQMKDIIQNKYSKYILFAILVITIIGIAIIIILSNANNKKIGSKQEEPKAIVEVTTDVVETLGQNENGKDYGKVSLNFESEKPIEKIWIENIDGTVTQENIGSTSYTKELELEYQKTYVISTITNDGKVSQSRVKVDVYPITYNANNGTGESIHDVKILGKDIGIKGNQFDAPTGYNFIGWAITKNGTAVDYNASATYSRDSELNLYAVWSCSGNTSTCKSAYTTTCNGKGSHKGTYCTWTKSFSCGRTDSQHKIAYHSILCKVCKQSSCGGHSPCEHGKSSSHTIYHPCTHGFNGQHGYCSHRQYATHYFSE